MDRDSGIVGVVRREDIDPDLPLHGRLQHADTELLRQRRVRWRAMYDAGWTLAAIGEEFGCSGSRVRQVIGK